MFLGHTAQLNRTSSPESHKVIWAAQVVRFPNGLGRGYAGSHNMLWIAQGCAHRTTCWAE
ncbi:hypothetical protein HanRHA438_Chr09g0377561 [Helianthus annuus]|nr:hypothetical protein HanRHA438_Chr09g0377561 [Helianthus annuus]